MSFSLTQKHFLNTIDSLTPIERDYFALIADSIFEKSGLSQNGIRLIDAISKNKQEIDYLQIVFFCNILTEQAY